MAAAAAMYHRPVTQGHPVQLYLAYQRSALHADAIVFREFAGCHIQYFVGAATISAELDEFSARTRRGVIVFYG